jgi:hypothetical protein
MNLIQMTISAGIDHGIVLEVSEVAALIPQQDRQGITRCSAEELQGWAHCLAQRAVLNRGIVPGGWIHTLHCESCGPVYSWRKGTAIACEWCHIENHFPRPTDNLYLPRRK